MSARGAKARSDLVDPAAAVLAASRQIASAAGAEDRVRLRARATYPARRPTDAVCADGRLDFVLRPGETLLGGRRASHARERLTRVLVLELSIVRIGELTRRTVELDFSQGRHGEIVGPVGYRPWRRRARDGRVEEQGIEHECQRADCEQRARNEGDDRRAHSSSRTAASSRASSSSVASLERDNMGRATATGREARRQFRNRAATRTAPPPSTA